MGAVFLYASPLVIEPLFNRFEELPEGKLRSEVLDLSESAGVDVGDAHRVHSSRRTTGANAYVAGLGHTKRVVLYDNLIEDFTPAEVRSVVAHELGHVKHDDVPRGLLFLARVIAPPGMLLVQRMVQGLAPWFSRRGLVPGAGARGRGRQLCRADRGGLRVPRGRGACRRVRPAPDERARRVHLARTAAIGAEHLGARPPELLQTLFGTHPTTLERIGYGVEYRGDR